MKVTISVDDRTFEQLMELAGTSRTTEAVNLAIQAFIRHERLRRFKGLRGGLRDLPCKEEFEALDLENDRHSQEVADPNRTGRTR